MNADHTKNSAPIYQKKKEQAPDLYDLIDQENKERLGRFLQARRKKKGMSIRQVALYSGVSNSYLGLIERGASGNILPKLLRRLCKPLDITMEEMMRAAGYLDDPGGDFLIEPVIEENTPPRLPPRQAKLLNELEDIFRSSPPEASRKVEVMLKAVIKYRP